MKPAPIKSKIISAKAPLLWFDLLTKLTSQMDTFKYTDFD